MAETQMTGPVLPPPEALEQMKEAARAISTRSRLATAAVTARREGRDALRRDFDPQIPDPSLAPDVPQEQIPDRVMGPELDLPREELQALLESFRGQGAATPAGQQSIIRRGTGAAGGRAGGGSGFGGPVGGGGMRDPGVATTTAGSPAAGSTVASFGATGASPTPTTVAQPGGLPEAPAGRQTRDAARFPRPNESWTEGAVTLPDGTRRRVWVSPE